MDQKPKANEVDIELFFGKLRENVVFAELALMQLVSVTRCLEDRDSIKDDLRVNLEIQEQALKDMLVLSIARLLDRRGQKFDQLSLPNILEADQIVKTADQISEIKRIMSLPVGKIIRDIRDGMVAHSLSHASDQTFNAADIVPVISSCYKVISDIWQNNKTSQHLQKADISAYSAKWNEMTKDWS